MLSRSKLVSALLRKQFSLLYGPAPSPATRLQAPYTRKAACIVMCCMCTGRLQAPSMHDNTIPCPAYLQLQKLLLSSVQLCLHSVFGGGELLNLGFVKVQLPLIAIALNGVLLQSQTRISNTFAKMRISDVASALNVFLFRLQPCMVCVWRNMSGLEDTTLVPQASNRTKFEENFAIPQANHMPKPARQMVAKVTFRIWSCESSSSWIFVVDSSNRVSRSSV